MEKVQAHFFEQSLPFLVFDLLFCLIMIRAINFYYEIQWFAIKIYDISIQWFLSVECIIHHLASLRFEWLIEQPITTSFTFLPLRFFESGTDVWQLRLFITDKNTGGSWDGFD